MVMSLGRREVRRKRDRGIIMIKRKNLKLYFVSFQKLILGFTLKLASDRS